MSYKSLERHHTANIARLVEKFGEVLEEGEIRDIYYNEVANLFKDSRITDYVPILSFRKAHERILEYRGRRMQEQ